MLEIKIKRSATVLRGDRFGERRLADLARPEKGNSGRRFHTLFNDLMSIASYYTRNHNTRHYISPVKFQYSARQVFDFLGN